MTPEQARTMAAYNRWMNEKIYAACSRLDDAERKADRGAFFKSIHGTLNHLLWGDRNWMGRFTNGTPLHVDHPKVPIGTELFASWDELRSARSAMDDCIAGWAQSLTPEWLAADLTWHSSLSTKTFTQPAWFLVTHFFNHQTHHRGQITTLLSQQGVDAGDTDLILLPV